MDGIAVLVGGTRVEVGCGGGCVGGMNVGSGVEVAQATLTNASNETSASMIIFFIDLPPLNQIV